MSDRELKLEAWRMSDLSKIPPRQWRTDVIAFRPMDEAWPDAASDLGSIWWRSTNWAVTDYGLEEIRGRYPIEKDRLLDDIPGWSFVAQVTGKTWCDPDEFATAWLVALAMHGMANDRRAREIAMGHRRADGDS